MGAWGQGAFDNDEAAEWSAELEEADDPVEFLTETLQRAADEDGYLKIQEGWTAVAAAAVVASTLPDGPPISSTYAPSGLDLAPLTDHTDLTDLAIAALDRVTGDDSEWRDVWEEVNEEEAFSVVQGLRDALAG
jgi:hypothetical protein